MTSQGGMQRFDESCSYFPKHILHEDPASEESQEPGRRLVLMCYLAKCWESNIRALPGALSGAFTPPLRRQGQVFRRE